MAGSGRSPAGPVQLLPLWACAVAAVGGGLGAAKLDGADDRRGEQHGRGEARKALCVRSWNYLRVTIRPRASCSEHVVSNDTHTVVTRMAYGPHSNIRPGNIVALSGIERRARRPTPASAERLSRRSARTEAASRPLAPGGPRRATRALARCCRQREIGRRSAKDLGGPPSASSASRSTGRSCRVAASRRSARSSSKRSALAPGHAVVRRRGRGQTGGRAAISRSASAAGALRVVRAGAAASSPSADIHCDLGVASASGRHRRRPDGVPIRSSRDPPDTKAATRRPSTISWVLVTRRFWTRGHTSSGHAGTALWRRSDVPERNSSAAAMRG
jgi:hypothetical protein